VAATILFVALIATSTPGRTAQDSEIGAFAYRQRPGTQLPLAAIVRDAAGGQATIGGLLDGKPAILALVYYRCPNICGIVLSDLFQALGGAGLVAGRDYTLTALSIDPTETPSDAAAARARDMAAFPLPGAERGWHYLTADAPTIASVADGVGFRTRFDPALKQFLHPAGLVFVTPNGRVSGYLLGVGYKAGDVRLGLVAAGEETLQKAALPIVLLCFHFDPQTGRYTLAVMRLLQIAAGITVLTIGGALWLAFRKEHTAARP
jgi:protein SCO1/2